MLYELRIALRGLLRDPLFSTVSVVVLALGLGASCATWSIVQAVLLRQLPYRNPDQLIKLWEASSGPGGRSWVAPGNFADWRRRSRSFSGLSAFVREDLAVAGQGEPRLVSGASVTPELPALLGVTPILGRGFGPEEGRPGGGRVLLVGEGYWRRELGADPAAVGRSLSIGGEPHTIVGVLPAGFEYPDRTEMWRPLALSAEEWSQRGGHYLEVVGRLRRGTSAGRAAAEMRSIAAQLAREYPDNSKGVVLLSLRDDQVGEIRPALLVLLGAVTFVLLTACANLTSLQLARATARARETAVRLTLGASRFQLLRRLGLESVLLALAGGAVGLLLARWGLRLMLAAKPAEITQVGAVSLDLSVVGFGLLLALATGLLAGIAPALQAWRLHPDATLMRQGDRTIGGRSRRLQSACVVGQIALALMLSIGAGLTSRSFGRLQEVKPGFDPKNVVTLTITLPDKTYPERPEEAAVFKRILTRIEESGATERAALVSTLPLSGSSMFFDVTPEGSRLAPGDAPSSGYDAVSPGYFALLRIPLLRGRVFDERDSAAAPGVCIVNPVLARRLWPGRDPLGQRLSIGDRGPNPRQVVGVVAEVHHDGLDQEPRPEVYVPYAQAAWSAMTLVARSPQPPARLFGALRRAIWAVDGTLPLSQAEPMLQVLADSVARRRFNALLLGIFAALALALAAAGLYGLMSQMVAERRREIGIRIALGAGASDVRRLVLKRGLTLVLAGLALGVPAALALGRVLSRLLFEVSAADPLTFAAVALALAIVSLLSSYLPAVRALRVDPLISMRS